MKQYKVLAPDLWYPTDPAVVRALQKGVDLPMHKRSMKHVYQGDVVIDIPTVSVEGLIANGWIEEVQDGS